MAHQHLSEEKIIKRKMLTEAQTASYIGMSRDYLRHDRMNGNIKGCVVGPNFYRIGRNIRYNIEDLDDWLKKFKVERQKKITL